MTFLDNDNYLDKHITEIITIKKMRIRHILENFNSMLNHRGIEVSLYDALLKLSNAELELKIKNWNLEKDPNLEILKTFSDDPESNLSVVVESKGLRVIIYWSQMSGKSFTVAEYSMLDKAMDKLNAQYVFVMCLYDKLPQKIIPGIEIFNYNDVLSDPFKMVYGIRGISVQPYDDWIASNPMIEGSKDIPACYSNDPLVRYSGGKPGEIMMIKRLAFLPTMLQSEEMTYRRISGISSKEMINVSGEYYYD